MSESKKNILKNKNVVNKKMTTILDYSAMTVSELKNRVGDFKTGRRGRPSKQDYIDELMIRNVNQRPANVHETKDEGVLQEEKGGEIPRVVVETKQQEDGKRRYAINDFNKTKQDAYNIGSEEDFKNYIAGLKKNGEYPNQRGRISEEIYRKYIAMRKINLMVKPVKTVGAKSAVLTPVEAKKAVGVEETKNTMLLKFVKPERGANLRRFEEPKPQLRL